MFVIRCNLQSASSARAELRPKGEGDLNIIYGQELAFDEEKHAYTWGGEFVPGVTSILSCIAKPALMPWAIGVTRDFWLEQVNAGRTDWPKIHLSLIHI